MCIVLYGEPCFLFFAAKTILQQLNSSKITTVMREHLQENILTEIFPNKHHVCFKNLLSDISAHPKQKGKKRNEVKKRE